MRLLDRYLLRELLVPLIYCLAGFFVFWLATDLLTELGELQRENAGVWGIVMHYWHRMPELLLVVVPVALLLASLYALTQHARHQEFTAIRAAGVSLWRLGLPYFGVGFVLSLAFMAVTEFWLPAASRHLEGDGRPAGSGSDVAGDWVRPLTYRNGRYQRIWYAQAGHLGMGELHKVRVDWQTSDGALRKVIADRGRYRDGQWVFDGVVQDFRQAPGQLPVMVQTNRLEESEFPETPAIMRVDLQIAHALRYYKKARRLPLSAGEVGRFLSWHHADLREAERDVLRTLFHSRLAEPWTCLVVVVIALPFGAPGGRRNLFVGVANSIVIAFSYFVARELGAALGSGGYLVPWLAAWLPNGIFATVGLFLTWRLQRPI